MEFVFGSVLSSASHSTGAGVGDSFIDRLSCEYSVFLMGILALLVTTRNFAGDPIACWCPDEFTDSWVDYTNQLCWVRNTYYLPFEERVPGVGEYRNYLGYYQWVGVILLWQAVSFYLPRVFWRTLGKKSGITVSSITNAAKECQKPDPALREKTIKYMVRHMGRFLKEISRKQDIHSRAQDWWWKIYGNYIATIYLSTKVIYIINALAQIYMLHHFLGIDYYMYGFEVLRRIKDGYPISVADRFPRVTFCDIQVRRLGNVQNFTIQCALPVNLFNEKVFIFVWFWLVLIAIISTAGFCLWLYRAVYLPSQINYIRGHLIAMGDDIIPSRRHRAQINEDINKFTTNYLRCDGVFILRLVAENTSEVIAAELICGLWKHFRLVRHNLYLTSLELELMASDESVESNEEANGHPGLRHRPSVDHRRKRFAFLGSLRRGGKDEAATKDVAKCESIPNTNDLDVSRV